MTALDPEAQEAVGDGRLFLRLAGEPPRPDLGGLAASPPFCPALAASFL